VAVVPEVSAGEQVDVYGFGVVLLELITGQRERKDEVHITTVAAPFLDDPAMTALMADPQLANRFPSPSSSSSPAWQPAAQRPTPPCGPA